MKLFKKILIITLLFTLAIFIYKNTFKKEHTQALKIATEIHIQCQQNKVCPLSLENIPSTKTNSPRYLKYRLTESRQEFVISYKGGLDPDCGYVLYGGVNEDIRKEMLCENSDYIALRNTYKPASDFKSTEIKKSPALSN